MAGLDFITAGLGGTFGALGKKATSKRDFERKKLLQMIKAENDRKLAQLGIESAEKINANRTASNEKLAAELNSLNERLQGRGLTSTEKIEKDKLAGQKQGQQRKFKFQGEEFALERSLKRAMQRAGITKEEDIATATNDLKRELSENRLKSVEGTSKKDREQRAKSQQLGIASAEKQATGAIQSREDISFLERDAQRVQAEKELGFRKESFGKKLTATEKAATDAEFKSRSELWGQTWGELVKTFAAMHDDKPKISQFMIGFGGGKLGEMQTDKKIPDDQTTMDTFVFLQSGSNRDTESRLEELETFSSKSGRTVEEYLDSVSSMGSTMKRLVTGFKKDVEISNKPGFFDRALSKVDPSFSNFQRAGKTIEKGILDPVFNKFPDLISNYLKNIDTSFNTNVPNSGIPSALNQNVQIPKIRR